MAIFHVNLGQTVAPWFSVSSHPYPEHPYRQAKTHGVWAAPCLLTLTPYQGVLKQKFYRLDALLVTQPKASKTWRQGTLIKFSTNIILPSIHKLFFYHFIHNSHCLLCEYCDKGNQLAT